jgi:DNA-binding transcriptional ArsR family regulator
MSKQTLKRPSKADTRRHATMFAALGDQTRLQLLMKLGTGIPQSIKQLTSELPVTRQAVTKHLRVLQDATFVTQETHGRERRFIAQQSAINEAQAALKVIAQQWDDALVRLKHFVEKT